MSAQRRVHPLMSEALGHRRRRLLGIILLGVVIFSPGFLQLGRLHWRSYQLRRRIDVACAKNRQLAEQAQRLESDPVYIEQVARQRLGVARAGETIVEVEEAD